MGVLNATLPAGMAEALFFYGRAMEKEKRIVELLKKLKNDGFTGFIRISYDLGGINRIEKNEEILKTRKA
jgi:hypothetical protein